MKFVSNRDIVHASTRGHSIKFAKGVPTEVPYALRSEVMAIGILPVEEEGGPGVADPIPEAPKRTSAPEGAEERDRAILDVIKDIVRRNSPKDFTGGGQPNASAVTLGLGWKVDQKDVRDIWVKNREELLAKRVA